MRRHGCAPLFRLSATDKRVVYCYLNTQRARILWQYDAAIRVAADLNFSSDASVLLFIFV